MTVISSGEPAFAATGIAMTKAEARIKILLVIDMCFVLLNIDMYILREHEFRNKILLLHL